MRGRPKEETVKVEDVDSPGEVGRPKNSTDTAPRERRTFKPALKASTEIWAQKAQKKISKLINPGLLSTFGKKNMRSLSSEETLKSEKIKFEILCSLEPNSDLTQESIGHAINSSSASNKIHSECDQWINQASEVNNGRLSIEEIRSIRASYYTYLQVKNGNLV